MSEVNTKIGGERVRKPRKPKKSQIPYAILVTILIIAFGSYLAGGSNKLPVYWGFGIAFGYILQRSRFCFTKHICYKSSTGCSCSWKRWFLGN